MKVFCLYDYPPSPGGLATQGDLLYQGLRELGIASKGAQEVMQALAKLDKPVPDWKYVCKVWPQSRTETQNLSDLQLAKKLGIADKVVYATNTVSRNFMPYLIGACDVYAAPFRLEGFGMPQATMKTSDTQQQ